MSRLRSALSPLFTAETSTGFMYFYLCHTMYPRKISIKIICFLLLFTTVSGAAQTGWYFLQSGTERHLHSIFFSDNQTGWAIGDSATILKANNGGNTWQTLNITRKVNQGNWLQLRAVWGFGTQEILVAGYVASNFASDTGIIIRTVDGGTTWNEVYSSYYSRIQQLHFISGTHGFASTVQSEFGQNQYLLETHDTCISVMVYSQNSHCPYFLYNSPQNTIRRWLICYIIPREQSNNFACFVLLSAKWFPIQGIFLL